MVNQPTSNRDPHPSVCQMDQLVPGYNTPLEHTQEAIPLPNYERIPENNLLVKVAWGVFHFGVLKQP